MLKQLKKNIYKEIKKRKYEQNENIHKETEIIKITKQKFQS